jgi:integrase
MANKPEDANKVFLTRLGDNWSDDWAAVSRQFSKLLDALTPEHPNIRQKGRGIYALRHVFQTVGGASRDQVAVDAIMGHSDQSMAATYREGIGDDRLQAVAALVHRWLFGVSVAAE